MKVTEEDLRRLFSDRPAGRAGCPAADVLADAAAGRFTSVARGEVADHLAACADCTEEYRLRRSAEEAEDGRPARGAAARARRPWAWAAAAAVVMAGTAVVLMRPAAEVTRERSPAAAAIRSLVAEERALPRAACILRWSGGPADTRYMVTVAAADLTTLHAAPVTGTELRVPQDKLAAVPPGGRIFWTVEATLPDGRRLKSPAFVARIE